MSSKGKWVGVNTSSSSSSNSSAPTVPRREGRIIPATSAIALVSTALASCLLGSFISLAFFGNLQDFSFSPAAPVTSRRHTGRAVGKWVTAKSHVMPGLRRTKLHKKDMETDLWPMPFNVTHGEAKLVVSPRLEFVTPDGSLFPPIIADAVARYQKLIFEEREEFLVETVPGFSNAQVLLALEINVLSPNETLFIGVDESYSLHVPFGDKPGALLEANTVYGALKGLETFSQLCQFDYRHHAFLIDDVPWIIYDKPRFPHRGLLVDTSRHYQPVAILERILDAMSFSKLNVFHWHLVDQQAFPLEIPSFPKLWEGAYSRTERFTLADVTHVVKYAADRGIVVVPEIDVPGHAESWGVGYPELWPNKDCRMPLDVSNNFTFEVIRGILRDLKSVIPYTTFHFGGDEVDWACWMQDRRVAKWLQEMGLSALDAYALFVITARDIALEEGWETIILWEETFQHFGDKLNNSVVVENWLNREVKEGALSIGLRVLVSLVGEWYLDHEEHDWWGSYQLEPCSNLRSPRLCSLIMGGETCMWTEHADPSNIVTRIWPRAAAVSERLWTPQGYTSTVKKEVAMERLLYFKCLLHRRGISSNYVTQPGWAANFEPGSCLKLR